MRTGKSYSGLGRTLWGQPRSLRSRTRASWCVCARQQPTGVWLLVVHLGLYAAVLDGPRTPTAVGWTAAGHAH
eukprot:1148923-Pelagomonas_calceolata.AAC.2